MFGRKKTVSMDTGMYGTGGRRPLVTLEGKETIHIYDLPATIGRNGEEVDVYLFDDSISRMHCRLDILHGQLAITDLYSTVGTKVERQQLAPGQQYIIESGCKIRIGKKKYRIYADPQELYLYQNQVGSGVNVKKQEEPRFSFDGENTDYYMGGAAAGATQTMHPGQAQDMGFGYDPAPEAKPAAPGALSMMSYDPDYDYDSEITEPLRKPQPAAWDDGEKTEVIDFGAVSAAPEFRNMKLTDTETGEVVCIIDKVPFIIGRKPDGVDKAIDAVGISRRHLRFDKYEDVFCVTDLESTNGVRINGEKIASGEETKIEEGDTVRFGEKEYRFERQ